jgi:tRNA(His) 5'-end guanylyltransferase
MKKESNMPIHDNLGMRMKTYYEQVPKTKLIRRMPAIIRCDGRSFHTLTRKFKRPFDEVLIKTMQETTKYLCENIQGCVLGYTQSDEISLILVDYQRLETSAWFDYEVQKMCSIAASMATMAFNKFFSNNVQDFGYDCCYDPANDNLGDETVPGREEDYKRYTDVYMKSLNKAMFDARVFNIPKEEVTNCIYWRQLDASRNSIQMLGQAYFSHKELQNKSCNDIQDMLMTQKGINWNDLPTYQKRGSCVIRNSIKVQTYEDGTVNAELRNPNEKESNWIIDKDIPIFKGEGREYIERLIMVE